MLDNGFKVLEIGFKVLDNGFKVLEIGFKVLDNGFKVLEISFKVLENGFKVLENRIIYSYSIYQLFGIFTYFIELSIIVFCR